MAETTDLAWLHARRDSLWSLFNDFHTARRDNWRKVVAREKPLTLPPELAPYWADMQDPIAEDDKNQRIGILKLDQTKIDCTPMGEGPEYERDVEKIRLRAAVSMLTQNQGRWRDQYIGEGQVLDGVAIIRKYWELPTEDEDAEDDSEPEWPWHERGVDAMQCAWDGEDMENPDIFMQEAEKRYYEARDEWSAGKGKKWRLNTLGKVVILGADEDCEEPTDSASRKVKFLICSYKEPETGKHLICEYIYPIGSWDDGAMVSEDEVPLGRCPYFIIPSGEINMHETDPHKRYRPMMLALLVWVYTKNFVMTLLAAMAQRAISDRNVGLSLKGMSPDLLRGLEGIGLVAEGAGAEPAPGWHPPELAPGDVPVLPGELTPWPNNISDQLVLILQEANTAIEQFRASRWQTGAVSDSVAANTTATTFSLTTQASRLPFGRALVMSDEFQRQDIESEHFCIKYWDPKAGVKREYEAVAPTTMKFLGGDYGTGGEAKAGTTVSVSAEMLRTRRFLVNVQTGNTTDQEQIQQNQRAFQEYDKGTLDDLQLYRRLGHDDPRAQQKTMAKFEARKMMAAKYIPFWAANLDAFFAATAGLNPSALTAGQAPVPQAGMPTQPQGGGVPTPNQGPIPPPMGVQGGNNPLGGVNGLGGA